MLLSLPCLDFFKTSWDSSPLHWIYREPLAYSHVGYLRSQGERFSTDRSRPRLKGSSLSLSLSLSLSRARAIKPIQPRAPAAPAPCRSIESCARSAPLLLSFLVAFQARRGPTTRSLLGSRTKDLLSFFTTRCVEELASKNNEFTFETKKSSHLKLFYSRFFFHLILKPLRGACKTVQKTRRTTSCAAGGGDGPEPEHGRGGREEGGEFDTCV